MSNTPRTNAAAERIGSLAASWKYGLIDAVEFTTQASAEMNKLGEMEQELVATRAALQDIATTAHCLAKAGPLNTPDLAAAWVHFMEIDAKATAALRPNT